MYLFHSVEEKLSKTEKRHKIVRWPVTSPNLRQHLIQARETRRSEVLGKLHREATERGHLLIVKRNASKFVFHQIISVVGPDEFLNTYNANCSY